MNTNDKEETLEMLQDAIADDLSNLKNLCTDMLNYGIEMIAPPPNYNTETQIRDEIKDKIKEEIKSEIKNEMVNEYKQIIDELCKVIEKQNLKIEQYSQKFKEHENIINEQNQKINNLVKENKHIFEKELEKEWDLHPYSQNGLITFNLNNKSFSVNIEKIDVFRKLLKTVLTERKRLTENELSDIIEPTKIPQFINSFGYVQSRVLPLPFCVMEVFSREDNGSKKLKSEMCLYEDTKFICTLCTLTW